MSPLQWMLVIGAGVAGYAAVSWLIDRSRAAKSRDAAPDAAPADVRGDAAAQPVAPAPAPLAPGSGEKSAWDEFNRR